MAQTTSNKLATEVGNLVQYSANYLAHHLSDKEWRRLLYANNETIAGTVEHLTKIHDRSSDTGWKVSMHLIFM